MAGDRGGADGADHEDAEYVITYDQLVDDVCWRLLARSSFGHVVFCQDGEPGALPVNSAVTDRTIVFRTSADATFFEFSHGSGWRSRRTTPITSPNPAGASSSAGLARGD